MPTGIIGRNFDVTPDIRALIDKKLNKVVERLFDDVIDTRVVLQVEKYRNICEILITGKEHDVKAVQESGDSMQDAINLAVDHVKRQAQKNRETIRDHHRKDGNNAKAEQVTTTSRASSKRTASPSAPCPSKRRRCGWMNPRTSSSSSATWTPTRSRSSTSAGTTIWG